MKKILDKVLSPQIFALCYLPWLAVNMVTVVNVLDFTRIVLAAFAVWAVAVCVRMYCCGGREPWTHKGVAVLLTFLAMCLLTQVLQFSYGGFDVLGKLCYFSLCLLILYSQHGTDVQAYHRTLRALVIALGIAIGLMMLVSDGMFLDMYSATITVRSGVTANVGFAENRLFGVFSSPNVGGTYALILIWCSVQLFRWAKDMRARTVWRTLAVVQIAAAVMYISVALSRGTYISGAVLVVSWMLLRAPLAAEKRLAGWKQAIIRVVGAAAALAVCVLMIGAVNTVSCHLMEWNYERKVASAASAGDEETSAGDNSRAVPSAEQPAPAAEQADPARDIPDKDEAQQIIDNAHLGLDGRVEADKEDFDISNNRFEIWQVHLSLLHGKHYVIGLNHPRVYMEQNLAAGATFTDQQISIVNYANNNMHNGYLQMLVNGGLLVLLPMLVFLVWCAVKALRYVGRTLCTGRLSTDTAAYALFSAALPMVLTILVNNLFETNFVLMGANFIQAFFWLIAGACVQSIYEGDAE